MMNTPPLLSILLLILLPQHHESFLIRHTTTFSSNHCSTPLRNLSPATTRLLSAIDDGGGSITNTNINDNSENNNNEENEITNPLSTAVTLDKHPKITSTTTSSTDSPTTKPKKKRPPKKRKERPRIPILQYHDNWVCVSKPAGLTVHRAHHTPRNQFVLSTLLKKQLSRKVYPVHRLDHRTSGAILFAFDSVTCGKLHQSLSFDGRRHKKRSHAYDYNDDEEEEEEEDAGEQDGEQQAPSQKEYIALLRGDWTRKFGTAPVLVNKPLTVKGILKNATTEFHLLAEYTGPTFPPNIEHHPSAVSLVLVKPKTGRTHQIRRHAYSIGFPVLGDSRYGDSKVNRWWREEHGLDRLFLHSFCLDIPSISDSSSSSSSKTTNDDDDDSGGDDTDTATTVVSTTSGEDNRINCLAPIPLELSNVLQAECFIDIWKEAVTKDPRLLLEPYDDRGGTFGRHYKKKL